MREVPALVAAHADYLQGMDYVDFAASFIHAIQGDQGKARTFQTVAERRADGVAFCQEQLYALSKGKLYFVRDFVSAGALQLEAELPDDRPWTKDHFPSVAGALVFENPTLTSDEFGKTMSTGMVVWSWQEEIQAASLALYTDTLDERDTYIATRNELNRDAHRQKGAREMPRSKLGRYQLSHYGAVREGDLTGERVDSDTGLVSTSNAGRFLFELFHAMPGDEYPDPVYVDRRLERRKTITPAAVFLSD